MAGPLLETKYHIPRRRRVLVGRPRLGERLSRGAESVLTLVSAPAGFGKTTLLADWLAKWLAAPVASARSAAWVSLDQRDNDPAVFWAYVVAALQTAAPGVGKDALSLTQSQQPPIDAVLGTLLNDLSTIPNDLVLVLDDYHHIESLGIQDGIAFLLENLPAQIHLVLAGRADPALPLARLRSRGELVEVRAAELRFTPDEAAAYLHEAMGLTLTADDVAALEGRTEGWIAALQLAALSMQGRDDIGAFIAGFAGDDRYIVDYLAEEVLQRQPADVHHFLLQTSILDRLSGPLCDAVTGQNGGNARLAALERGNLFLVPLDDRRKWYRYHQLFADVLHAHLLDEAPGIVRELHQRASAWFEQFGEPSAAIHHALAAGDFERAASLIELAIPATRRDRQEATLLEWLTALPDEVIRARPMLSVSFAATLVQGGDFEGVERRLLDAERWLHPTDFPAGGPSAEMVVVDTEEFRQLPGLIELYRAALLLARGDAPGTVRHAARALDLSADDHSLLRAAASGLLGLAYWMSGDLDEAHRAYSECTAGLHRAGHVADTLGCAVALADIRITQGRLGAAMHTYDEALQIAIAQGGPALRGSPDMHVGMSEVARERGDLRSATEHLLLSQQLGEHLGLPQNRYRWRVAMSRVRQAEGDLAGALELLNDAERLYKGDLFPNVRPVPALRARLSVELGRLEDAVGWVRDRGLSVDDDLSYLREFEHITLARVLLAQHLASRPGPALQQSTRLLERLLQAAEAGARTGRVIEILVLQALSQQAAGNIPAALALLERALTLAEPEGYLRIFVDEGPTMVSLLKAAGKKGSTAGYVRRLLAAVSNAADPSVATPDRYDLIEPLSERELAVLRLLGSELDGPDIARRLTVSLNTVRTHTKHIYEKLGVNNRRAAVRRAEELDLLSRSRSR